jgi:hypothetical protein
MPRTVEQMVRAAQQGARAWALRPDAAEQEALRVAATQAGPHRDAALVLWSAGELRRRYRGGSWTWDLLAEGLPAATRERLRTGGVHQGLRQLGRQVSRGQTGQALRLSTLVAEAGLPGAVLGRPRGAVHEWCRGVLRDLRACGIDGSDEGHEPQAGELAARRAPDDAAWLRDPGVSVLVGLLCLEVLRLHTARPGALPAGDEAQVVAWLDARDSAWRQRLPIDLGDNEAVDMVRALLGDAAALDRAPAAPVLRTTLWGPHNGGFLLERRLRLTRTLAHDTLRALFGIDDGRSVPPRLTLTNDRGQLRARLLRAADGHWTVHEGDAPPPDGAGPVRISLRGLPEGPRWAVGLAGAEALPADQPWVFAPPPTGEGWALVGLGTTRRREPRLRVVLPLETELHGGEQRELGALAGRRVVELAGAATLRGGGGDIELRAGDLDADEHVGALTVRGPRHPWSPPELDVLWATPSELKVRWVTDDGAISRPPAGDLLHRSSRGGPWSPGMPPRSGRWRLRWARGGRVDETCLILLVPGDGVELREVTEAGGVLAPLGQPAPLIEVASGQAGFTHRHERGALRLTVNGGERAPARVRVGLTFLGPPGQRAADAVPLELPFPARRVGVLDRGGRWTTGPLLLDQLAGCRAEAVDPSGRVGPLLTLVVDEPRQESPHRLPGDQRGWGMDLSAIRGAAARLLAVQSSPDAAVRLRFDTNARQHRREPEVQIARYARRLVPGDRMDLRFESPLSEQDAERVTLQAHRLDAVAEPRTLPRLRPGQRWAELPGSDPGWWLLVARDGAEEVARPRLRRPPEGVAGPEAERTPLARAVTLAGVDQRRPEIVDRLRHLGSRATRDLDEGERADLELVHHHLGLLSVTSGASLDVVRGLADAPWLAARLVTEAACDPAAFHRLWEALEELPFLWALVPHAAWRAAWTDILDPWSRLGKVGVGLRVQALGALCLALPALAALTRHWLQEEPEPVAAMWRLAQLRQGELQQRQRDAEWPAVPPGQSLAVLLGLDSVPVRVDRHDPSRWPVLRAPWAAAACAHRGVQLTPLQIDELRRLRDFDPDWFDEGLFIATAQLAYGLPEVTL